MTKQKNSQLNKYLNILKICRRTTPHTIGTLIPAHEEEITQQAGKLHLNKSIMLYRRRRRRRPYDGWSMAKDTTLGSRRN
jgi:pyridoxine 5'-phosphate synthase PdxJ